MKTTTHFKKTLVLFLCFAVLLSAGITTRAMSIAKAEQSTQTETIYEWTTGRPQPSYAGLNRPLIGRTKAEISAAFDAEISRLYREIDAFDAENSVTNSIRYHVEPISQGWPTYGSGTNAMFIFAMPVIDGGSFFSADPWGWGGTKLGIVMYNPHMNKAFFVANSVVNIYLTESGWYTFHKIGYPTGYAFSIGDVTYQNFTLGYLSSDTSNSTTNRGYKAVNNDGTLSRVELTVDEVANNMAYPMFDGGSGANISGLERDNFITAYKNYCNTYNDKKPVVGDYEFVPSATYLPIWRQRTATGNAYLVFNPNNNTMFKIANDFKTEWEKDSFAAIANWGYPTADSAEIADADFTSYQQFSKGVATLSEGVVTFHHSSKVNEQTGEIEPFLGASAAGMLSEDALELIEDKGVTQSNFENAVAELYSEQEMGLPIEYMTPFSNNSNVFIQEFALESGGDVLTSIIFAHIVSGTVKAFLLDSDVFELYYLPDQFNDALRLYDAMGFELLGAAISNVFTVNSKQYQNFAFGMINITDEVVRPGENVNSTTGAVTIMDLSDRIVASPTGALTIPSSFSITQEQLVAKFKTAYKQFIADGFSIGTPNREGISFWTYTSIGENEEIESDFTSIGMIKMGLHSAGSVANAWYTITAYLAYNPKDGNVYLVKDGAFNSIGLYYNTMGAPTANQEFIKDGKLIIQNFEGGYLTISPTTNIAVPKWGVNYSAVLGGEVNLDGSRIEGVEYENDDDDDDDDDDNNNTNDSKGGCGGSAQSVLSMMLALAGIGIFSFIKRGKLS